MSTRLRVATRKGLFTLESRGSAAPRIVRADLLGDNCSAVLADPRDDTLYVALDHGHFGAKLQRSRDGGRTFEEIPAPAYPQREDAEPWLDMHGREVPNSLLLAWCLEAGHATQPGRLWCGTVPGGLFRSDDGGDSWSMVESLWDDPLRRKWFGGGMDYPGIHSVCQHPDRPDSLAIGVSCGGVWHTADGGATWACRGEGWRAEFMPPEQAGDPSIQDVHRLARCAARPEALWAQHHNGIFRSIDEGATWTEITGVEPSAFGFACAVHPEDPDTAWFVPEIKDERRIPVGGRLVVTRTRDGGGSFQTLAAGLPQEHAYDIVYRHGLDLAADGRTLAMGSTTGALWLSRDAGDRFEPLASHLPPIYAVRIEA